MSGRKKSARKLEKPERRLKSIPKKRVISSSRNKTASKTVIENRSIANSNGKKEKTSHDSDGDDDDKKEEDMEAKMKTKKNNENIESSSSRRKTKTKKFGGQKRRGQRD